MKGLSPGSSIIERRNFVLNAVEGALFAASGALINPQTVLPALIYRLGGSNVIVGTLGLLVYGGVFLPQIFAARYVETIPWKKPWAVRFGTAHRLFVLAMGMIILLFGNEEPATTLWLVLLLFTVMQLTIGVATPGWFDLFAKLTHHKARGRLGGIRTSVGGAAAFLCGFLLTWMLATFPFPLGFALAFFVAFLLQMSSLVTQMGLVESEPSSIVPRRPIFAYLEQLPGVFRANPHFKDFILSCTLLTMASMPVGLYTVYALQDFHADGALVGQFTLAMVGVQVISALVNGYLADRYGNKVALIVAAVALLGASLTALVAPSVGWFRLVYLLLGVNLGTEMMARYNMAIEYGPARQRSTYIGLMNTIVAPFYLSGVIGGIISEWLGFTAVFSLGVLFSSLGLLYLVRKVRDPRPAHSTGAPA